jgi:hypothetical protein
MCECVSRISASARIKTGRIPSSHTPRRGSQGPHTQRKEIRTREITKTTLKATLIENQRKAKDLRGITARSLLRHRADLLQIDSNIFTNQTKAAKPALTKD